jgi:hypothetical protein
MNHYWTANDPVAMRQAQIEDWIEDLVEFPIECIEEACREWRRQPDNRRPTPGEIRSLAMAHQQRRNRGVIALPAPDVWELSYGDLQKRITERWGNGWGSCWYGDRRVFEKVPSQWLPRSPPEQKPTDPVAAVREALGVTATPSYEDPEALRRGRIELGLEPGHDDRG